MSLFDACVDLNPHQIDAALFALRSPLAKGVVLADEVGLGKTIEAGLILCQFWAERRRKLLVICPASIRKQWALELAEKFNLPSVILDARSYRLAKEQGHPFPFSAPGVVIVSINFASKMEMDLRQIAWDLVVIDEAHKLRNAYRPSNIMGQRLRAALDGRRKVLLTATPLQNSLLELYGLSTIIDDYFFGDATAFRTRYMRQDSDLDELRSRLRHLCKRTLRNQVTEYIQFTERKPITQPFRPSDDEHKLYEAVSAFLLRNDTFSIPQRQRTLITLILRKLLASSSHAIAGTLATMKSRLEAIRDGLPPAEADQDFVEQLIDSEEMEYEFLEEDLDAENATTTEGAEATTEAPVIDRDKLNAEIAELDRYSTWARSIGVDTKSRALFTALDIGFREMAKMGADRKALIFTESRRTQDYLKSFLEANGYTGKVVLFNGTNSGPEARAIYDKWVETNKDTGRSSGSRLVDIRTALIEHFRDYAEIMVATEAAAEGINLQFCSLVINYDLPWNPQRIEQRIGRCHRYGQKHDVVVINFLNQRNEADQRVLQLLADKFNLFSGVFGASDEVLGAIESGVDFEKRVLTIYQTCRTTAEIETAFKKLQEEMEVTIQGRLADTRQALLEYFDEDVHARLKVQLDTAREQLDQVGRMFWTLTEYLLNKHATFDAASLSFDLHIPPRPDIHPGRYHLISKKQPNVTGDFLYRLSHPLGEHVLETGKQTPTPCAQVAFDITGHPTRISAVEALKGRSGWLTLHQLTIESFENEQYLLFSGFDDDARALDQETCEKLFRCDGSVHEATLPDQAEQRLAGETERHRQATIARSLETNNEHFQAERERLEKWAEDMVLAAEKELADTKAQIKAKARESRLAATVDEQHRLQKEIQELEREKRRLRQRIFDAEDEINDKRDSLIDGLEKRLSQRTSSEHLFSIRWTVV